jgi:hypothetical protein
MAATRSRPGARRMSASARIRPAMKSRIRSDRLRKSTPSSGPSWPSAEFRPAAKGPAPCMRPAACSFSETRQTGCGLGLSAEGQRRRGPAPAAGSANGAHPLLGARAHGRRDASCHGHGLSDDHLRATGQAPHPLGATAIVSAVSSSSSYLITNSPLSRSKSTILTEKSAPLRRPCTTLRRKA